MIGHPCQTGMYTANMLLHHIQDHSACNWNNVEIMYLSSRFRPDQKSTLSIVADVLGAAGGFAGK